MLGKTFKRLGLDKRIYEGWNGGVDGVLALVTMARFLCKLIVTI